MPVKENKTNEKKMFIWKKKALEKSLKHVFSHVTHLYLFPLFKVTVSVWEQAELIGWTNGEPEPDYHTRNHHHQTPLTLVPSVYHSWPSTCALFWQSLKKWQKQYALHTHTQCTHEHWRPQTANAHTVWHKRLHMQEPKNSLRSGIKNRPGKIKAGLVRLSLNALTVCLSEFGYLWRTQEGGQAGRQAERGEALEMKRRRAESCTAVLLPLQLAPRLIRMGESTQGGGERHEAHIIFSRTCSRGQKCSSLLLPACPSKFSCLDNQMWHVG